MSRGKQTFVVKPDLSQGLSWSNQAGTVTIPATREQEPNRPYQIVIDDLNDMQRIATHLKNAIKAIEEGRR